MNRFHVNKQRYAPGIAAMMALMIVAPLVGAVQSVAQSPDQSEDQRLVQACEAEAGKRFETWEYARVREDVAEFARSRGENPTVVFGDFDDNLSKDVAFLIQVESDPETQYPDRYDPYRIVACLRKTGGATLHVIEQLYCSDGIMLTPKGKEDFDYETEKEFVYQRDGVAAYCFEKAGATYIFENGTFRRIIDSD